MTKKWLWLTIAAVAVGGFVAGMVVAQEGDFDFLPAYYAQSHTPTLLAWREVQFNALEDREVYLTDRIGQTSCELYVEEWGIDLEVGTSTEFDWDMYLGDGNFACSEEELRTTYAEVAEEMADIVRDYFPELEDENLYMGFFMEGVMVAAWEDGETFVGDELFEFLFWF